MENGAVAAAIAEAKRKLAASQKRQKLPEKIFPYMDGETSSGTSFSHATYSVSSDSSVSLSAQIEPAPPVPPKLYYANLDSKTGNLVRSSINNNDLDSNFKDRFATIRSTAV